MLNYSQFEITWDSSCILFGFQQQWLHDYSQWRYERSSRLICNLSNCEREAWKKFRLQRDSNPWALWYRCSALPTELWSHDCWEQVNFSGSIMPLRVVQHYSDWDYSHCVKHPITKKTVKRLTEKDAARVCETCGTVGRTREECGIGVGKATIEAWEFVEKCGKNAGRCVKIVW